MNNKESLKIKRNLSLAERLRTLPSGTTVEISARDYKISTVRNAIFRLKKKGYTFEATETGVIDGIRVTRISR